ncbi:nuclease-related domain-containing protein [Patulibacter sp. NPDC049589]|uniref:nuclease-related domain-containing protein n=1 Tax=Patulibacter sp. NPDC049589 TaxID=3154731 RepID=UPI00341F7863
MGLLAPVVGLAIVAVLWFSIGAPFAAGGDAARREGPRATGLRVESSRKGERARLTITGRVPRSAGSQPVVVRVLGRADVAGSCPVPRVRRSGALSLPDGSARVGWSGISGTTPGRALRAGAPFRMVGTVATLGPEALRLCVHLVRAGAHPEVLRTERIVVPSRAGITPLSVVAKPIVGGVVVPVLEGLAGLLLLVVTVRLFVAAVRRIRWARPAPASTAPRPLASGSSRSSALDLPPLPEGVHVPDTPPWLLGEDAGDGSGRQSEGHRPHQGGARRGVRDDATRLASAPSDPDGRGDSSAAPGEDVGLGPTAPTHDAPMATPSNGDPAPTGRPATPGVLDLPTVVAPTADPDTAAGVAGASARAAGATREARWRERRRREVEAEGRVWDPTERAPFHVRAWSIGAVGEELAAERFASLARGYPGVHVLHDRREPGRRRANIDHVLVGPAGVVVADTKHWAGVVRIDGERLLVRGRDRTAAVDGVRGQVSSVRAILMAAGLGAVPVQGALHWTRSDGVLLDGSLELSGVALLDARGTMMRAVDGGVLGRAGVRQVLTVLERGLSAAA